MFGADVLSFKKPISAWDKAVEKKRVGGRSINAKAKAVDETRYWYFNQVGYARTNLNSCVRI